MKWLRKLIKFVLILGVIGALAAAGLIAGTYYYLEPRLPSIDNLRDVRLQVPLRVFAADEKLIAEFGEKRRIPLSYEQVPETMVHAFLAAEDDSFFSHPGVDIKGLIRAGMQLILTGQRRQGGSTITMQVARNFYLTREKTFTRKLNEILLALKIEQELSKEEILELYLNKIYLGHRSYGVGAAAQIYYGGDVKELTLAQTAMIAGLPKAPSRYNPIANAARAVHRRNYVLDRMHELGYISEFDHDRSIAEPVTAKIHTANIEVEAPYVAEMVRSKLFEEYGDDAYTSGYRVYTTLDSTRQTAANAALRKALEDYDERHGYRGAERHIEIIPEAIEDRDKLIAAQTRVAHLSPGLITAIDEQQARVYLGDDVEATITLDGLVWARKHVTEDHLGEKISQVTDVLKIGDIVRVRAITNAQGEVQWRLSQIPDISGAFVALDPVDGAILALVGGYDFYHSKFNRVTQARRQPGSGFKAFIYSAALEAGFSTASIINDAPVVLADASLEEDWRPENYSGKFFGPTRLRYALTKSRNLVSIRLLRAMGVDHTLKHARRFGFDPESLPGNLSLALGSGAVSPLQMARGYAVLANGGFLIDPYHIKRIESGTGETIFEAQPRIACPSCGQLPVVADPGESPDPRYAPRVITPQNRYLMYSMMQDVIRAGTATKARVLKRSDLAGKTGTTNEQRDAWFNGYNQSIVAITWVGFDSNDKLGRGEVGGKAALPAWIDFMKIALEGVADIGPEMPANMVTVRIDPETGERAPPGMQDAIYEVFRPGEVPELIATTKTAAPIGGGRRGATGNATAEPPPVDELF